MSTSPKTILVVGAGPAQVPAIEMARSRGLRVAATDRDGDAEGFKAADISAPVSTRDVEGTVAFARDLAAKGGLHGVMTMASESGVTVAEVARALGLPGVGVGAARKAADKIERLRTFEAAGVPSPRFAVAETVEGAVEAAASIGWPVVVKPRDGAGSRGVRKVADADGMREALEESRSLSVHPQILIEEFLTGSEHSIEGVVSGGRVHWTGFSDRNYEHKERYLPHFLEDGDTLPTTLDQPTLARVEAASTDAVSALGIDWGPVKGDILVTSGGQVKVIEMAARLSGDYFCNETVPLHNSIDLLSIVMDLSLGITPDPAAFEPAAEPRGVALRYVWPKPGRVTAISGVEEARALPGVRFVRWEPRWRDLSVGTVIGAPRSMGERIGSVLASAPTREGAVALAEKAVAMIEIETVPA